MYFNTYLINVIQKKKKVFDLIILFMTFVDI